MKKFRVFGVTECIRNVSVKEKRHNYIVCANERKTLVLLENRLRVVAHFSK